MIHKHHRKRRSQGGTDSPENILELEDWVHGLVHTNVSIAFEYGLLVPGWLSFDEAPPPDVDGFLAALGRTPVGTGVSSGEEAMQTTVTGEEIPHRHVVNADGVEKECPKCHGKGKIIEQEKPEGAEQAPARAKTTWSVRVPKDERENGYEVLESLLEAAVDRLADAKLIRDRNKGANYYALVYVLHDFLTDGAVSEELGS